MRALPSFNPRGLQPVNLPEIFIRVLKWVLAAASALPFFSCDNYRAAEPVVTQYVKVTSVNRDTVISISNEKLSPMVGVSFTETLSDTAIVSISSDTAF